LRFKNAGPNLESFTPGLGRGVSRAKGKAKYDALLGF